MIKAAVIAFATAAFISTSAFGQGMTHTCEHIEGSPDGVFTRASILVDNSNEDGRIALITAERRLFWRPLQNSDLASGNRLSLSIFSDVYISAKFQQEGSGLTHPLNPVSVQLRFHSISLKIPSFDAAAIHLSVGDFNQTFPNPGGFLSIGAPGTLRTGRAGVHILTVAQANQLARALEADSAMSVAFTALDGTFIYAESWQRPDPAGSSTTMARALGAAIDRYNRFDCRRF